jgi:hypothetical protein
MPFPVDDEPVLVSSGQKPDLNFPDSCFIPTETQVTRTPMVEIPDHENVFGLRGFAGQFDLHSLSFSFDIWLMIMSEGHGYPHNWTAVLDPLHIYSFHNLSFLFQNILHRPPATNANASEARSSQLESK